MPARALLLGMPTNQDDKLVDVSADGLLHHTLVVGQSGSGKSFFVARLIEEILLRTRARVFIVDPNGDFRSISSPSASVWSGLRERFDRMASVGQRAGHPCFDSEETFAAGWARRRFLSLTPGRQPAAPESPNAVGRRLLVHWDMLDEEHREFLLKADPSLEPKVLLGLEACIENSEWMEENRPDTFMGHDLRGLLEISEQFAARNLPLRSYEYAKNLTTDDWYAVRAKVGSVLKSYSLWWSRAHRSDARPPGLADYIDGSFSGPTHAETYWDSLTLALDAATPADGLLAVDVALSRLWLRAKEAWRRRLSPEAAQTEDTRVPTFIVVDEAHNFAPEREGDPLRERVTRRLATIASEGRKYGLYLVLATQRPTKLRRDLVPECENCCVLRVQSDVETEFASKTLGIPPSIAQAVQRFRKGQGLLAGRWVNGPVETIIAPARSLVGGGGLADAWLKPPDPSPPVVSKEQQIAAFVHELLESSAAPVPLVSLAATLREEFEDPFEDWLGAQTLKGLLQRLRIPDLQLHPAAPGFAYLRGVHTVTAEHPAQRRVGGPAADLVELAHRHIGLPLLEAEQYRALYEAISAEVQGVEFNLSDASKAVRDRCARIGVPVGRQAANYLLKGIHLGGHRYAPDLPQDVEVLAAAFCRTVEQSLKNENVEIDPDRIKLLLTHVSGGASVDKSSTPNRTGAPVPAPR